MGTYKTGKATIAPRVKFGHFRKNQTYFGTRICNLISIQIQDVANALALLLTDTYGLYFKTTDVDKTLLGENVHTHHDLLVAHRQEIFVTASMLTERIQKLGGTLHRWPVIFAQLQEETRLECANSLPCSLLAELLQQNKKFAIHTREIRWLCAEYGDSGSRILLTKCIEEADRRVALLMKSKH